MPTITVKESSRGKVPSCYVNQTFDVVQTRTVDHIDPNPKVTSRWDEWAGHLKNGTAVTFMRFAANPELLFVKREGAFRGTWLTEFEIVE